MKITDWRRKLAIALLAGGLMTPGAAMAADLNVNLLTNPGFENLNADPEDAHILDWLDGTELGFTYASGEYDNGGPLAGGGSFYFTANGGNDITLAGEVSQLVDVSMGDSAALIASGTAFYSVGGFFTSFADNGDFGTIQVDFLDNSGATLGSGMISDDDVSTWNPRFTTDLIPVGTQSALVSVFGTPLAGGPDGYIDNVDFQVTEEEILPLLDVHVDRDDGSLILSNLTGTAVNISGYQITSAFESLEPDNWVSIAENYDGDSGGDVDGVNSWSELTQVGAHGDLSEGDLDSGAGGSLAHTQSINLGNSGTWIRNPIEDLVFQYVSDGNVVRGLVDFEGTVLEVGDLNADGLINSADWAILRSNQHTDLSGLSLAEAYRQGDLTADLQNNHADFVAFKTVFDAANGAGAFVAMVAQNAVPEPSAVVLVLGCGVLTCSVRRRSPW